jgi:uncharacterized membrane protein YhfC
MEGRLGLLVTYVLAVVVEIGLPVTLAILVIKKLKVHWLVILTGVLTFIGSQVVHIPLLQVPALLNKLGVAVALPQTWPIGFYALYLGIMAGLCEETARFVGFKLLKSKAASYKSAFGLGVGHGGIESILLAGLPVIVGVISVLTFNPQALLAKGVAEGTVNMGIAQVAQFWASPWHLPLAGAFERVIAISAQILMSFMVWKAVVQRSWLWYLLAVAYHTLLDCFAVYLTSITTNAWVIEGALSIFLVVNVILLVMFWRKEKKAEAATEAPVEVETSESA